MKQHLSKEAKIGLFAVLMLAALYWGINFLKGKDIFSNNNTYYAVYEQINGIQKSSAIMIKGFEVGVVSNISYDLNKNDKIVLEFNIKSKYNIPKNSKARIFSSSILGDKSVEIELGNSDEFLKDFDTLYSEMDPGLLEIAGSEFEQLKQKASVIISDVQAVMANINLLLSEQNQANISTTLSNLAQTSGSLNNIVAAERENIKQIIANVNTATESLKSIAPKIDKIAGDVAHITDSTNQRGITYAIAEATAALSSINMLVSEINNGEGSIGMLMKDRELYNNLTNASGNLAALLQDLKTNPKRYINVSVFGKKDKTPQTPVADYVNPNIQK